MNYLVGTMILVGFIIIISLYARVKERRAIMFRIRLQYGNKPDRDFIKEDIQYLIKNEKKKRDIDNITWNDLDMDKVYSRINNCNSFIGEQVLYKKLHYIIDNKEEIDKYETMIQYLDNNKEIREKIQVLLEKLGRRKVSYYLPQFVSEIESFKISNIVLYRIMSFVLLSTFVLGIFVNKYLLYVSLIAFLINSVLYAFGKHKFEMHLEMLSSIVGVVTISNTLIKKYDFIPSMLAQENVESISHMSKVVNRIGLIQRKMDNALSGDIGAVIFDYLIGSTLWDFHIFHRTVSLIAQNREEFMNLYNLIGDIDSLISVSSYRKSITHYCEAKFQGKNKIQFNNMYHPLVDEPVCNDVNMDSNYIITGSNASGKSTYIKAVAINMILAQSINTCLANNAQIPYANIMTSMAVRDDVTSGESYYIREINYLKRIITQLRNDKLTLCIVDEILRGTNTEERIAASVAILNYLNEKNCLAIVASHDIEISEMLCGSYQNCHFSEEMKDNDIYFDYKVKGGISKSKNAIKLLSHIGFPEEIVKYAEKIINNNIGNCET